MRYLITGKFARKDDLARMSHEEFVEMVKSKVAPSLKTLLEPSAHGKVLAGGVPAGGRNLVFIADLRGQDSRRCVRQFLMWLPAFDFYEWEAVPLGSFEELAKSYGN